MVGHVPAHSPISDGGFEETATIDKQCSTPSTPTDVDSASNRQIIISRDGPKNRLFRKLNLVSDLRKLIIEEIKYHQSAETTRAGAYSNNRQYDLAVPDCSEVIKREPNNSGGYNCRGVAYEGLRDYRRAIADYDQSISINPRNGVAYPRPFRGRGFSLKMHRP